jgi:hypothetical protein
MLATPLAVRHSPTGGRSAAAATSAVEIPVSKNAAALIPGNKRMTNPDGLNRDDMNPAGVGRGGIGPLGMMIGRDIPAGRRGHEVPVFCPSIHDEL